MLGPDAHPHQTLELPAEPDDGFRLLVTRYRPRGVSKADETWDRWIPKLGPSKELHAAVYTMNALPISWPTYRARYIAEQRANQEIIQELGDGPKPARRSRCFVHPRASGSRGAIGRS